LLTDVLKTTAVFRKLKSEEQARVAAVARLDRFRRGELLFRESDPSDRFILVATGRVKVFKTTAAGKDVILEIFGPGDPVGAVALYEGFPFPASAVALEETTCVTIGQHDFFQLLEQYPTVVRGLLLGLTYRIVELTNRLADLTGHRVETRFARLFLKMSGESGRRERDGVFVPMPLSRQELADLTGTTIETAIRIMSRWGKDGIVRTEKDGFTLLDRETIDALALS
jgi:CRP/FNR family transcriptional regulator